MDVNEVEIAGTAFRDSSVDYAAVARTVRGANAQVLAPSQYQDVIACIEWMRDQAVALDDHNNTRQKVLDAREKALEQRERDVAIRMRAATAAATTRTLGARWRSIIRR